MQQKPLWKKIKSSFPLIAAAMLIAACLALCSCSGGSPTAQNDNSSASASSASSSSSSSSATAISNTSSATSDASKSSSTSGSKLTVRFLDVGQGDATLLECDGHWVLIDGGKADQSDKIYAVLKNSGVTKLDAIIATHPDADHIGGISGALNYTTCDVLYCSTTTSNTKTFDNMVKYLNQSSGIGITVPACGDTFDFGEARITFVGPTRTGDSENNNSLVMRVELGNTVFLFPGDAEQAEESSLVLDGADLKADVLHVAHHGSASSSTMSFLRAVSPRYAVISVGENSYGHPTEKALNNLSLVNAQVLRTDQSGDITFVSDGSDVTYTTAK